MTRDEVNALSGDTLNAAVAEALGWTDVREEFVHAFPRTPDDHDKCLFGMPPDDTVRETIPRFDRDPATMPMLLAECERRKWSYELCRFAWEADEFRCRSKIGLGEWARGSGMAAVVARAFLMACEAKAVAP